MIRFDLLVSCAWVVAAWSGMTSPVSVRRSACADHVTATFSARWMTVRSTLCAVAIGLRTGIRRGFRGGTTFHRDARRASFAAWPLWPGSAG